MKYCKKCEKEVEIPWRDTCFKCGGRCEFVSKTGNRCVEEPDHVTPQCSYVEKEPYYYEEWKVA